MKTSRNSLKPWESPTKNLIFRIRFFIDRTLPLFPSLLGWWGIQNFVLLKKEKTPSDFFKDRLEEIRTDNQFFMQKDKKHLMREFFILNWVLFLLKWFLCGFVFLQNSFSIGFVFTSYSLEYLILFLFIFLNYRDPFYSAVVALPTMRSLIPLHVLGTETRAYKMYNRIKDFFKRVLKITKTPAE